MHGSLVRFADRETNLERLFRWGHASGSSFLVGCSAAPTSDGQVR